MKYKVGDKVRVRKWDDMVEEFGEYIESIDIPICSFTKEMREYCGEIVTIKEIKDGNSYYIKEDNEEWYWVDEMFEYVFTESNDSIYAEGTMLKIIKTEYGCFGAEGKTGIVTSEVSTHGLESFKKGFNVLVSPDEIWRINVDATVESIKPMTILSNPKHNDLLDSVIWISSKEKDKRTVEEIREMMKENTTAEAKKRVHPKDEDHLKRVEKIQKKIDYYKRESGFEKIEKVVPGKILNIKIKEGVSTIFGYEGKIVCDERDKFSMEYALYLALAKCDYGKKYTSEGIEKKAGELKFERCYVNKVEKAEKLLAAMEELEKENAEYEALLEARRQKRWERKQRQMDRRAEKKKAQEEKEREEKIQIQTEAYLRAMKAVKEEEKKEENVPVEEENNKVESKPEENMTETTKESTKESTENTEETAATIE